MTTATTTAVDARFQLLGPVRAWAPDAGAEREIDLGPGKQRAVLAVLLLHPGRPVPTARIVDAVWGDEPPANGVNVVQKYVAGLRRALEPARSPRSPGQLIALTDGGYVLTVPRPAVDAARFADVVAAGVAVQRAGEPEQAVAVLRDALDLWHGEPLAGLGGSWFAAERERLVDRRGLACEAWAAAELDLGQHDRLTPELRRLADEFPLRERLRELLMLALYRSGRRAEALAVFRDTRAYLVDEVGAEPGAALQDLFARMLRSDPALDVSAAGTGGAGEEPPPPSPGPISPGPISPGPISPESGSAEAAGAPPRPEPGAPGAWVAARPVSAPPHPALVHLGRGLVVTGPLLTLGFGTFVFFGAYAVARRSAVLAWTSAAYFVLIFLFVLAIGGGGEYEDLAWWRDAIGILAWCTSGIVGTAHLAAVVHAPGSPARRRAQTTDTAR